MIKKGIQIYRRQAERWRGKQIIENSPHAAPDFMIIGAAKSGTTSLFQYLAQHPQIVPPAEKEIKYFGMRGRKKGLRWYLGHYPLKSEIGDKLTFEATPTYIYKGEKSARPIARLFPDMKSILILRDPVKRAFSHWTWYQKHSEFEDRFHLDERSFPAAVREELRDPRSVREDHRYIDKGLYARQLKGWYQHFDRDQILVLDFEELQKNPKDVLKAITAFLGIADVYGDFEEKKIKLQGILKEKDRKSNKEIKVYNANVYREELDEATEKTLRAFYAGPDTELEKMTGKEFSWMH